MRFVSVVTSTRCFFPARTRISSSRSSTWPFTGRTSTSGSIKPGRPNHLLHDHSAGLRQLVRPGRGGYIDRLVDAVLEFFKCERPIIERRRHPETVVHQGLLARAIAVKHAAHLRNRLVRFVDEQQIILRARNRAASAALHRADGPTGGANNSRCRGNSRWCASSRCRNACAAARVAPRRFFPCRSSSGLPPFQLFENRLNGAFFLLGGQNVVRSSDKSACA